MRKILNFLHSAKLIPLNYQGCVLNGISNVIICGHSDCKAMSVLHSMEEVSSPNESTSSSNELSTNTPIKAWIMKHGMTSLQKFHELQKANFTKPLMVKSAGSDLTDLQAFIDVDNVFSLEDKLSQVNTLMQMENIASYPFMQKCIQAKQTQIHAMWYDIHSGEVYLFSKSQKHFLPILDQNVDQVLEELKENNINNNELTNEDAKAFTEKTSDVFNSKKCS